MTINGVNQANLVSIRTKAETSLKLLRRMNGLFSKGMSESEMDLRSENELKKALHISKVYRDELSKSNYIVRLIFSIELELDKLLANCIADPSNFIKNTTTLEYLLKAGMNPNIRFKDGSTLLCHACAKENLKAVEILLDYGADPNLKPYHKDTPYPLTIAAYVGQAGMVEALLKSGAKVNAVNRYSTALLAACGSDYLQGKVRKENVQVIKILLKYGADINFNDKQYNAPPLVFATLLSSQEIVQELINGGADRKQLYKCKIVREAWRHL